MKVLIKKTMDRLKIKICLGTTNQLARFKSSLLDSRELMLINLILNVKVKLIIKHN